MQASLWGEMIRTTDDVHYLLYPRLLAFAERAWHMAAWETADTEQRMAKLRAIDWTDFANTVGYKELMRLERLGINYRLSTPGVRCMKFIGNFPLYLIMYLMTLVYVETRNNISRPVSISTISNDTPITSVNIS